MRITIDSSKVLIDEAMKVTHINTKTQLTITTLEDLVRKSKISGLMEYKGKVVLDVNMSALRWRKRRS